MLQRVSLWASGCEFRVTKGGLLSRIVYTIHLAVLGRTGPLMISTRWPRLVSRRTFSPRHESHARGRLRSVGDLAAPGLS